MSLVADSVGQTLLQLGFAQGGSDDEFHDRP
jgi:hypothetical protein